MEIIDKILNIKVSRLLLLSEKDRKAVSAFLTDAGTFSLAYKCVKYFENTYEITLKHFTNKENDLEQIITEIFAQIGNMSFETYSKKQHESYMQTMLKHTIKSVKVIEDKIIIAGFITTQKSKQRGNQFLIDSSTLRISVLFYLFRYFNEMEIDAEIMDKKDFSALTCYFLDSENSIFALKTEKVTHLRAEYRNKLIITFNSNQSASEFYIKYLTTKK